jgi:hypothetical protein
MSRACRGSLRPASGSASAPHRKGLSNADGSVNTEPARRERRVAVAQADPQWRRPRRLAPSNPDLPRISVHHDDVFTLQHTVTCIAVLGAVAAVACRACCRASAAWTSSWTPVGPSDRLASQGHIRTPASPPSRRRRRSECPRSQPDAHPAQSRARARRSQLQQLVKQSCSAACSTCHA